MEGTCNGMVKSKGIQRKAWFPVNACKKSKVRKKGGPPRREEKKRGRRPPALLKNPGGKSACGGERGGEKRE